MSISGPHNTGTTAGGAGASTANSTTGNVIAGELLAVYVRYNGSPPAGTTDLVIATAGSSTPATTLLTLTDGATDGLYILRGAAVDNAGGAIANSYVPYPVHDKIKITISQANDGDSADVWFFLK